MSHIAISPDPASGTVAPVHALDTADVVIKITPADISDSQGMSHELRSPLSAILGLTQLMSSEHPPATTSWKASIDQILHTGWYLLELINEILDLAVIESGKLSLSAEPVALIGVMADCQALMEPQGQMRGINITFPTSRQPFFVRADRTRQNGSHAQGRRQKAVP